MNNISSSAANPSRVSADLPADRVAKAVEAITIAALDLGSNSFHLVVARAHSDKSFEVLLKEKAMIRLGDVVSRIGYIDELHLQQVIDSIRSFRNLADSLGATEMVAMATSAFRDAENSSEVVDLIEESTGVSVSVISGHHEAAIIFKAISTSIAFPGQIALCVDLGGGSLELMVGSQTQLLWSHSVNIGVGRLTAKFVSDTDSINPQELEDMRLHVHESLAPLAEKIDSYGPSCLIGSSGSFLSLGKMALLAKGAENRPADSEDLNQVSLKRSKFRSLGKTILKSSTNERLSLPGIDAKRADILPAAVVVLEEIFELFGFSEMTLSEWALREGMILSELESYESLTEEVDSVRMASVLGVAKRFALNFGHARHVADLALSIFDQTIQLHGLSGEERELLEYGALLHDVGEHISMEDHDRHSAYLIEHSKLRGFTPEEKRVLICIGRFHRRGNPKGDFAPFAQLRDEGQVVVVKLVALLRLADALDRSHEFAVTAVEVRDEADRVLLLPKISGELELEMFGLRKKRSLFEQTFGKQVVIPDV